MAKIVVKITEEKKVASEEREKGGASEHLLIVFPNIKHNKKTNGTFTLVVVQPHCDLCPNAVIHTMKSLSRVFSPLLIAALLGICSTGANAKKLAKVKAGLDYKTSDDVHIIVNSVG